MDEATVADMKARARDIVAGYLRDRLADSEEVIAVDSDGPDRLMVRIAGRSKDFLTIWFFVGERTLSYECYFMPDPDENHEALYRYLLMKSTEMYACRFSMAPDHDIFITGQIPIAAVTEDEVDRIVGSIYHYTDVYFKPALRIGFASYFRRLESDGTKPGDGDENEGRNDETEVGGPEGPRRSL